jgi:hypothetical protein
VAMAGLDVCLGERRGSLSDALPEMGLNGNIGESGRLKPQPRRACPERRRGGREARFRHLLSFSTLHNRAPSP